MDNDKKFSMKEVNILIMQQARQAKKSCSCQKDHKIHETFKILIVAEYISAEQQLKGSSRSVSTQS